MKFTYKIPYLILAALLTISGTAGAADQFDKTKPAGSSNASDIDTLIQTNNAALDRLVTGYRVNAAVIPDSSSTIKVLAGELAISNAAGSVVRWRRNTSTTSVTWSDIDTGSESSGAVTQYYVYAVADADATTFTIKISLSSSAPSGATYYRKIGYFTNNASNDIVSVGNVSGGDVKNVISVTGTSQISTTSTSYTDMTDMVVYLVSSGRPVLLSFEGPIEGTDGGRTYWVFDVDGTDYSESSFYPSGGNGGVTWENFGDSTIINGLSAGTHTVKVQWKVSAGTAYQDGSTATSTRPSGIRNLIVEEL